MSIIDEAVSLAKLAYDLLQDAKTVELRATLADLTEALSVLKVEIAKEREDRLAAQSELVKLKKQHSILDKLIFRDGVYFLPEAVQNYPEGPFCPVCYGEGVVSLMQRGSRNVWRTSDGTGVHRFSRCHRCKAEVADVQ